MYTIKITYDTGDSFNRYDGETEMVGKWKSKELATENAKRLAEHYDIYKRCSSNHWGDDCLTEKEAIDIIKTKEWCPIIEEKSHSREYLMLHSIMLKLDDGSAFQFGTSTWCGYFESLVSIEVVCPEQNMIWER
ncbi:MAG: hypothetical protein HGA35_02255 [Erysipelotrichaceae bacterium]|nr:hypothetical protein [Erysipelotrichaceae bacterium]